MIALVGTFNQEKALEGAFSVIVKTDCETLVSDPSHLSPWLSVPSGDHVTRGGVTVAVEQSSEVP